MSTYNRKYYLHRRLKEYLRIDAKKRQVSGQATEIEALPATYQKYIQELITAGYNIQLEIPITVQPL